MTQLNKPCSDEVDEVENERLETAMKYVEALKRLVDIAHRDHGQATKIRGFLLGLFNGYDFPYDLTNLRALDQKHFEDCMSVLRLDVRFMREIHNFISDGGKVFQKLSQMHC